MGSKKHTENENQQTAFTAITSKLLVVTCDSDSFDTVG